MASKLTCIFLLALACRADIKADIKEIFNEYRSDEALAKQLNDPAGSMATFAFVNKGDIGEHMITFDVHLSRINVLTFVLRDAKSAPISKKIEYNEKIFGLQKDAMRELVFRMLKSPKENVGFTMLEDVIQLVKTRYSAYKISVVPTEAGFELTATSNESVVFIMKAALAKTNEVGRRANFIITLDYTYSNTNKKVSRSERLSVFSDTKTLQLFEYLEDKCVDNMWEFAEVAQKVFQNKKQKVEILTPTIPNRLVSLITMKNLQLMMSVTHSIDPDTKLSVFDFKMGYLPEDVDEAKLSSMEPEEPFASLKSHRMQIAQLENGLREVDLSSRYATYINLVYNIYRQVHAATYAKQYPNYTLDEQNLDNKAVFSETKTRRTFATRRDADVLIFFEMFEAGGKLQLSFTNNSDSSSYVFDLDVQSFSRTVAREYITALLTSNLEMTKKFKVN